MSAESRTPSILELVETVRAGMTLPHLSPKARAALDELAVRADAPWWKRLISALGFGSTLAALASASDETVSEGVLVGNDRGPGAEYLAWREKVRRWLP